MAFRVGMQAAKHQERGKGSITDGQIRKNILVQVWYCWQIWLKSIFVFLTNGKLGGLEGVDHSCRGGDARKEGVVIPSSFCARVYHVDSAEGLCQTYTLIMKMEIGAMALCSLSAATAFVAPSAFTGSQIAKVQRTSGEK